MASRKHFIVAIIAFGLMSLNSLYAQREIEQITVDQAVPGKMSILTVTGKGFLNVTNVEVQVDDVDAAVENITIVSDTELKIAIRFPQTGRSGRRHTYAVKVAGEGTAEAIPPRPVIPIEPPTIDTIARTPVTLSDPDIAFLLAGVLITEDTPLGIAFEVGVTDSPASRNLTIKNVGQMPLLLHDLQKPAAFEVVGFPNQIPPDSSATLTIRFLPDSGVNATGVMRFNTNIPNRSLFSFQLTGTARQTASPTPVISPFAVGKKTLLFIIPIILTFVIALIVIRRIVAGKRIHIKPVKDLGQQTIQSTGTIKSDFELSLKPSFDFGKSEIHAKGRLTKQSHIQQAH